MFTGTNYGNLLELGVSMNYGKILVGLSIIALLMLGVLQCQQLDDCMDRDEIVAIKLAGAITELSGSITSQEDVIASQHEVIASQEAGLSQSQADYDVLESYANRLRYAYERLIQERNRLSDYTVRLKNTIKEMEAEIKRLKGIIEDMEAPQTDVDPDGNTTPDTKCGHLAGRYHLRKRTSRFFKRVTV
jgi:DNA helicase HerA-like ATPase